MADNKTDFTLNNGDKVKSNVSGFEGIITCRADHLNGCNRYFVNPKIGKDGKMPDGYWIDEDELSVTSKEKLTRGNTDRGGFASMDK